jgi:outer membrane protein
MKPVPALRAVAAAALFAAALPGLARAQEAPGGPPAERNVFAGDRLTLGVGLVYGPSYDGSDDYVASPIPVLQGSLAGIAIAPRPAGLALDVIPDKRGAKLGFSFGPVATLSNNRAEQIKDPVVRAAGKLDTAFEIGGNAGITVNQVLHPFDSITLSADVKWDVAGAHSGRIVAPSISYASPLSRGTLVTVSASLRHVDGDYARYYYSVSPAQSAASGLPRFDAHGGWESWSLGALVAHDLNGNALDGGFSVVAIGAYSRMINDSAATPYTALRGDADQWTGLFGLAYTF